MPGDGNAHRLGGSNAMLDRNTLVDYWLCVADIVGATPGDGNAHRLGDSNAMWDEDEFGDSLMTGIFLHCLSTTVSMG